MPNDIGIFPQVETQRSKRGRYYVTTKISSHKNMLLCIQLVHINTPFCLMFPYKFAANSFLVCMISFIWSNFFNIFVKQVPKLRLKVTGVQESFVSNGFLLPGTTFEREGVIKLLSISIEHRKNIGSAKSYNLTSNQTLRTNLLCCTR